MPNIIAIIPTTILIFEKVDIFLIENPLTMQAKPKNNKLNPTMMDTDSALKTGKIIKINPNMINKIPKIFSKSIFFLQFTMLTFLKCKSYKFKSKKPFILINFSITLFNCYYSKIILKRNKIFTYRKYGGKIFE